MAPSSSSWSKGTAAKSSKLLEYLLLFPTATQQINRFLRAGLSVFAAGKSIVAILPEGLLGIVQKVSCLQENKPLFLGLNGEFVPYFVTGRCRNGGSAPSIPRCPQFGLIICTDRKQI